MTLCVCVDVCVWVCVCACMHLLPPHQSTAALLLIALHSAHLSTCLLVLVISLPPPPPFPTSWSSSRLLSNGNEGSALGREVRRDEVREQGGEEMRRWEKEAWNPMMGSAQHPEDYSKIHIHQCSGRERSWSTHQRFSKWNIQHWKENRCFLL